jgi:ribosomal protein S3AE
MTKLNNSVVKYLWERNYFWTLKYEDNICNGVICYVVFKKCLYILKGGFRIAIKRRHTTVDIEFNIVKKDDDILRMCIWQAQEK